MASVVNLVFTDALIVLHMLIAAVTTRFFRLRLRTQWGYILYALFLIPLVLLVSTPMSSGIFGIGVNLGNPTAALDAVIGIPLALDFTIDTLYVSPPEEYGNLSNSR